MSPALLSDVSITEKVNLAIIVIHYIKEGGGEGGERGGISGIQKFSHIRWGGVGEINELPGMNLYYKLDRG